MGAIGKEYFLVAFGRGAQKTGSLEFVQLYVNGITWFPEFSFQTAQITSGLVIEKEFEQWFDACLGSDLIFNHL